MLLYSAADNPDKADQREKLFRKQLRHTTAAMATLAFSRSQQTNIWQVWMGQYGTHQRCPPQFAAVLNGIGVIAGPDTLRKAVKAVALYVVMMYEQML